MQDRVIIELVGSRWIDEREAWGIPCRPLSYLLDLLVCFCSNNDQITTKTGAEGYRGKTKTRTNLVFMRVYVELVSGLEPLTCWLRISCSTDWATPANTPSNNLCRCILCLRNDYYNKEDRTRQEFSANYLRRIWRRTCMIQIPRESSSLRSTNRYRIRL